MTALLETLSHWMTAYRWLAPVLALVAGMFAAFSPCALSSIPLIIGYVGGVQERDTKRAFRLSVVFAAGSALTFAVLGVVASLAGQMLGNAVWWWYLVLGVLMVLMALQTWGVVNLIPSSYLVSKNRKTGLVGAFLAGILAGIFSSPCSTPVLIALLALAAGQGSLLWGTVLMLLYGIGHGTLAVIAGTSVGWVQKLSGSAGYGRMSGILKGILGALMLLIGLYMFYLGF